VVGPKKSDIRSIHFLLTTFKKEAAEESCMEDRGVNSNVSAELGPDELRIEISIECLEPGTCTIPYMMSDLYFMQFFFQ
jgi:hypothetical protein